MKKPKHEPVDPSEVEKPPQKLLPPYEIFRNNPSWETAIYYLRLSLFALMDTAPTGADLVATVEDDDTISLKPVGAVDVVVQAYEGKLRELIDGPVAEVDYWLKNKKLLIMPGPDH